MSRAPVNDETRFEMAMAASGRERRNRPVALVVLAGAALLIAGIAALTGLVSRAAARIEYQDQVEAASRTEGLLVQLQQLRAAESSGSGAGREPIPFIISKLEDAAISAGLTKPAPPRDLTPMQRGGITVKEYTYSNVRADSLAPLLEWIRLAMADIPGLELHQIAVLRPEQPFGWTMTVSFRRWERTG